MSVVKSKQYIASTQFLSNLQKLEKEVLAWCKSQGNKNTSYGLSALFETTNKAFINAFQANKTYLKDEDSLLLRKQYLDNSIRWLHNFNAQLTALLSCYNISNTKIKGGDNYDKNRILLNTERWCKAIQNLFHRRKND